MRIWGGQRGIGSGTDDALRNIGLWEKLDFFRNLLRDCDLRLGGARNPHLHQVNSGVLRSGRPQLTAARHSFERGLINLNSYSII